MTTGEAAYPLRATGMSWFEVLEALDLMSESNVRNQAKKHAKTHGLPWPVGREGRTPLPLKKVSVPPDLRTLGQRAYVMRAMTGASWTEIAQGIGDKGAKGAAQERAREQRLPWPLPTKKGLLKKGIPTDARTRDSYLLAKEGVVWRKVADILGYATRDNASEGAKRYALEHRLQWPLHQKGDKQKKGATSPRSRLAYEMRRDGKGWEEIGEDLGVKAPATLARKYAGREGLPWPIVNDAERQKRAKAHQICCIRTLERLPWDKIGRRVGLSEEKARKLGYWHANRENVKLPYAKSKGEYYYQQRSLGKPWRQIADENNIKHDQHVVQNARRWALKNDAVWPPVPGDGGLRAYFERMVRGSSWKSIAEDLGYSPEYKSGYNAAKAARNFSENEGLPWPVPVGGFRADEVNAGKIYFLRGCGFEWVMISQMCGFGDDKVAVSNRAKAHARRCDLPWPLDSPTPHRM